MAITLDTKRLVFIVAVLGVFAMSSRISLDSDTWWHLRAGQWMLEHNEILQADQFSYTRLGEEWKYPGWIFQILMYMIYNLLGLGGLNILTATIVTTTFIFIWFTLEGGPLLKAFVLVLAAATSAVYWAARPYLVTFLFSAIFFWILEDFRWRGKNRIYWLPVIMLLWANSHGGFIIGFLLWGVYLLWFIWCLVSNLISKGNGFYDYPEFKEYKKQIIKFLVIGIFMLVAVCINPSGPVMLLYPFKTIGISVLRDYIEEWQSPNFHISSFQPFALMIVLIIGVLGASRKRIALTDFLLVSSFLYMSFYAARNVAIFALVTPAMITRHATVIINKSRRLIKVSPTPSAVSGRRQQVLNSAIVIILIILVLVKAAVDFPEKKNYENMVSNFPVYAVNYLEDHKLSGHLFSTYNWGGYLMMELVEYPVFIDGRTDLYTDAIVSEWLGVMRMEGGWGNTIEKYNIQTILIPADASLTNWLDMDDEWKKIYIDEVSAIFTRNITEQNVVD